MDKSELRKIMRRRNRELPPEARAEASSRIFGEVERLPAFAGARVVGLFCSLPDEPDTRQALARWCAGGRRVVVPCVEGDEMDFYDCDGRELVPGAFGIVEPPRTHRCDPAEIDLLVVPGVAFAPSGSRLGRGRGYYDRYLAQPGFRAATGGVCYRHQLVDDLPAEPHDRPVGCVVAG